MEFTDKQGKTTLSHHSDKKSNHHNDSKTSLEPGSPTMRLGAPTLNRSQASLKDTKAKNSLLTPEDSSRISNTAKPSKHSVFTNVKHRRTC